MAHATKVSDLKANPDNPRKISDEKLGMLDKSMKKFGDLSGIVANRRSGLMVGGHQRVKQIAPDAEVVITQRYKKPTRTGTVAEGYVLLAGERFTYREVWWDAKTEKAANIAANAHGGEWEMEKLTKWVSELRLAGLDLDLIGFTAAELDERFADKAGTPGNAPTLADKFLVPPFTILDARQGYWQERKRQWLSIGIQSELGRGGASPGGSARPAAKRGPDGKTLRGDGAGRALRK
jgi:hypothetical protein